MEGQRRKSIFHEVGLSEDEPVHRVKEAISKVRPTQKLRFRSTDDVFEFSTPEHDGNVTSDTNWSDIGSRVRPRARPTPVLVDTQSPLPQQSYSMMYRFGALAFVLATVVPLLQGTPLFKGGSLPIVGVNGGVIRRDTGPFIEESLVRRDTSPTTWCFKWGQQSAIVNGTLYLYGGQASTTQGQGQENTWNNDFLTIDLTKDWQTGSPTIVGLPQPSGPPAVSLGTLWNSYDSLYLYGGEFSSYPPVSPVSFALWEYNIQSSQWIEHNNPETSNGPSAPSNNVAVQRAAEGAGITVPALGRGFYFGGHLDGYTTSGWDSYTTPRVYLQSLLEFTMPGYTNNEVYTLANGQTAGTDGNYRNVTVGGLQSSAGFTERADGLLIYVPGFGAQGILLALAGGVNDTFTQMNNIDVYDIATSSWYIQYTSGQTPNIRVNPCAVIAAAPDGSSYNIYMFGGQSLQPAGNQTQYNDMWILTLPSFTWIPVDMTGQSVPYGRSGHTCNVWDGQMVMVGGYVGDQLSCDAPGIYVFDMSNLQWVNQFTALSPGTDDSPSSSSSSSSGSGSAASSAASASSSGASSSSTFNSTGENNPLNQQPAQLANGSSSGGLEGSYGYQVPAAVISIIGGASTGGATVTAPIQTATGGPLATGKPITYTVTGANGATVTETSTPGSGTTGTTGTSSSNNTKSGPNIAAIVAGTIAGLLFLALCYVGFCALIYRKQLKLYKRHVDMTQRQARGEKLPAIPGLLASDSARSSSDRRVAAGGMKISTETSSQSGGVPSAPSGTNASGSGSGSAYQPLRRGSSHDSTEDLMADQEPTFVGILLNPRRSLRVVNRD